MSVLKYWDGSAWVAVSPSAQSSDAGTVVQEVSRAVQGAWGTTNLTTNAVISVIPAVNFVKKYAGTTIEFTCGISGWITGAAGVVYVGCSHVNSGATVNPVAQFFFNDVGKHFHFTGFGFIQGLAAGTYACTWWTRVANGATTWTSDGNDLIWTRIREVW